MDSLLVLLLCLLCILCYTGQTFFNKLFSGCYPGSAATATPVYASIYGLLVCVITFCLNGFRFSPSGFTWGIGAANGLILFFYNLGMIQAARRGPYAFQSIVMLFGSIVVCIIFSALWWGDRMTALQIIGICIMLAGFVALNAGNLKFSGIRKGYFFWVFSLFFTNGFYGVLMDFQQRSVTGEKNEMIMITFLSSAVISLFYLFLTQKSTATQAFRMGKKPAGCAVFSSICAAFAVYLLMVLLAYVPSYILYTVNNGSILVLSALLSAAVLKEKLTAYTVAGVVLSVISIVLLSL